MILQLYAVNLQRMNLSGELISWYDENKRDLPWRKTTDAYIIWLSEIILQQTRVDQGMPYFYRFAGQYPRVIDFAAASEDAILKLWQGLGYYSRGRNMLQTARQVRDEFDGVFPVDYLQLLKLKGIGEYTAAAISSFAANEVRAVVDGNVNRVLARFFGINEPINSSKGKKLLQQIADEVIDKHRPALHNQAIMEFGALLCKPKKPACGTCPVRIGCEAFKNNATSYLPVKLNKIKVRKRFFNYLLIVDNERVLMNKRDDKDIWANMNDLPLVESDSLIDTDELIKLLQMKPFGYNITIKQKSAVIKHILTHQHLYIQFLILQGKPSILEENWFYTEIDNLKNLPIPQRIFIFIKDFFNF